MMAKVRRIRILLATELEDALCRKIGVEKISLEQVREVMASGASSLALIPDAGLLVRDKKGMKSCDRSRCKPGLTGLSVTDICRQGEFASYEDAIGPGNLFSLFVI